MTDPFGTDALRDGTILAWRNSPTRLREDAAAEADLVRAGYRDRLLTELAQNAADAAARADVPGTLRVELHGDVLRIANTGAPLDIEGVQALAALRASGKSTGVGRFGVGFTAVRSVSDEIELRSTSGSLQFSAARTRVQIADSCLQAPASGVPVLRLVWATDEPPAAGFDSEVVLHLRPDVDGAALLGGFADEAVDCCWNCPRSRRSRSATARCAAPPATSTAGSPRSPSARTRGGSTSPTPRAGWFRWSTAASAPSPRTCCARPPGPTRNCRCPRC